VASDSEGRLGEKYLTMAMKRAYMATKTQLSLFFTYKHDGNKIAVLELSQYISPSHLVDAFVNLGPTDSGTSALSQMVRCFHIYLNILDKCVG
jgi:hypothetical protein